MTWGSMVTKPIGLPKMPKIVINEDDADVDLIAIEMKMIRKVTSAAPPMMGYARDRSALARIRARLNENALAQANENAIAEVHENAFAQVNENAINENALPIISRHENALAQVNENAAANENAWPIFTRKGPNQLPGVGVYTSLGFIPPHFFPFFHGLICAGSVAITNENALAQVNENALAQINENAVHENAWPIISRNRPN